jgi:competence ComEA-like helix-hairpin-helix protein
MFKQLQQYFTFSTGERRATITIVLATILVVAGLYAYRWYAYAHNKPDSTYSQQVLAFAKQHAASYTAPSNSPKGTSYTPNADSATTALYTSPVASNKGSNVQYFKFDPNTIGVAEWVKLGFSEKQAASIEKYKAKGGKFYKPEDLKRVYVIGEEGYNRLKTYIQITAIKETEFIDLNTADSVTLDALYGIGPVLSHKIIAYRNKLGGYVTVNQLQDIELLSAETYEGIKSRLKVDISKVQQININYAEAAELKIHPYIKAPLAKAICKYRDKHGDFKNINDLKNVPDMPDSIFVKLQPYLKL